ncbi:MAG: hypothetical protein ACRENE_14855 [Polyangiaceae bacterium]
MASKKTVSRRTKTLPYARTKKPRKATKKAVSVSETPEKAPDEITFTHSGATYDVVARRKGAVRQWFEVALALPSGASLEIHDLDGALRVEVECHCDPTTLTLLSDALRAAVVEIDEERERLVSIRTTPEPVDVVGLARALATKARP